MKKILAASALLVLASSLATAQMFSLKIGGGYGASSLGDFASGIQGVSDYLTKEFGATETFSAPKKGVSFDGEFVFRPWPFLGLGIGAGLLDGAKESQVSYAVGAVSVTETIKPSYKVIPVTVNIHLTLPLFSFLRLDAWGGVGDYFAKLDWDYRMSAGLDGLKMDDHYTFSGKKSGIGFQAGLGVEIGVSRSLAVVLAGSARWVKIGPFRGAWTDSGSGDFGSADLSGSDDALWAYDLLYNGTTYPRISFQTDEPGGGPWISNPRQPKIDFSGFALTLGVKYAFGR